MLHVKEYTRGKVDWKAFERSLSKIAVSDTASTCSNTVLIVTMSVQSHMPGPASTPVQSHAATALPWCMYEQHFGRCEQSAGIVQRMYGMHTKHAVANLVEAR